MAEIAEEVTASGGASESIQAAIQSIDSSKGATSAGQDKTPADTTQQPEIPQYSPNFKYKAMREERELDDWIRPFVTDADKEKKIREMWEKAAGLDHYKNKYGELEGQYGQLNNNYGQLHKDASEAMWYKNQGDLDSFFQKVSLPNEKIYQWVLDKIQRQNLPPEQQRIYNELDARRRNEYQMSGQMSEIQQQYHAVASQAREAEVDAVLARNDVHDVVSAYDSKNGPGAFKNLVAEYGIMHYQIHGRDPAAADAIKAVVSRVGDGWRASQPTASPASGEKPLPVIPNVAGRAVSPTRKSPRSIDDLRKLAQEAGS